MGYYDDMMKRIAEGGGVATATLGELRDAINVQRLGPYVLEQIADTLHREGIDFFPESVLKRNEVPRQQHQVRLVALNPTSPIYKAMKAVQEPTVDGDKFLCALETSSATARAASAQDKLERARGAIQDALAVLDEPDDAEA